MTIPLSRVLWLAGASAVLSLATLVIAVWKSGSPSRYAGDHESSRASAERERIAIIENVRRSVVRVSAIRIRTDTKMVRDVSGERMEEVRVKSKPLVGSGFIFGPDGRVATNFHVVSPLEKADGEIVEITVTLEGEMKERGASLIAKHDVIDLAVLQIQKRTPDEKFPALEFGDSHALSAGADIMAFGYPFQMPLSPTAGIVSNPAYRHGSHPIPFLMVDCRINPGNSGGPVVDLSGKVAGVMTRVTYGGPQAPGGGAFGLAIPAYYASDVLESMESGPRGGWLGFICTERQTAGGAREVVVVHVTEGSPAAQAGLRGGEHGDVLTEIDGQRVSGYAGLQHHLNGVEPGQKITLSVRRGSQMLSLNLAAVAESERTRPPDETDSAAGLTVRNLRPQEIQRFGVEEGVPAGVVITAIARGSRFEDAVQPGDVIRLVRNARKEIHQLTGADDFKAQMDAMSADGGEIHVDRGDQGDWVPFGPDHG